MRERGRIARREMNGWQRECGGGGDGETRGGGDVDEVASE